MRRDHGWRPPTTPYGLRRAVVEIAAATVVGASLGTLLAMDAAIDWVPWVRSAAWVVPSGATRTALGSLLGIQITLMTIVLSVTALAYQSVASQYSPRLVALLASEPLYRAIAVFALSGAFAMAGIRQLGLSTIPGDAPQPVLFGGIIILVVALGVVITDMVRVFQRIQVEEIVRRIAQSTLAAARRVARARSRLQVCETLMRPSSRSAPIAARHDGYVIAIDLDRLEAVARRVGAQVRIDRRVGDYVVAGEALGWFHSPHPSTAVEAALARAIFVARRRDLIFDVEFGLQVLADIANRALSPGINDPTTARQALHQMRRVLRALASMPLGDITMPGEDGEPRVSTAWPSLDELLFVAVDGASRHGASDPAVVAEILELALQVGRATRAPEVRAAARAVAAQALSDAVDLGRMSPGRLASLEARDRVVARALADSSPAGTIARGARSAISPGRRREPRLVVRRGRGPHRRRVGGA